MAPFERHRLNELDNEISRSLSLSSDRGPGFPAKAAILPWMVAAAIVVLGYLLFWFWHVSLLRTQALNDLSQATQTQIAREVSNFDVGELTLQQQGVLVRRLQNATTARRLLLFDQADVIVNSQVSVPTRLDYQLHRWLVSDASRATYREPFPIGTSLWWDLILLRETTVGLAFRVLDRKREEYVVTLSMPVDAQTVAAVFDKTPWLWATLLLTGFLLIFIWRFYARRNQLTEMAIGAQIDQLEDLLSQAKSHQRAMRSASSHAVQLNEQFLRRIGSDLHDGPAQSISYAILRLRSFQERPAMKELGHEYYVLIESLETALNELRGLSHGLVLPELAKMTLEQSLRKVTRLHRTKHVSEDIEEHYVNLEQEIDLGIKICAYRFVQEGLNNATEHGQPDRVRVSAVINDGVLRVSLKDDGMGFRLSKLEDDHGRLGLKGLRDRIESLGGRFNIASVVGSGVALKLTIPLGEFSGNDGE